MTRKHEVIGDRWMYLLTFWPPGPEDLLKETSPSLRGIVLAVNEASHFLASDWSWSEKSSETFDMVDERKGR